MVAIKEHQKMVESGISETFGDNFCLFFFHLFHSKTHWIRTQLDERSLGDGTPLYTKARGGGQNRGFAPPGGDTDFPVETNGDKGRFGLLSASRIQRNSQIQLLIKNEKLDLTTYQLVLLLVR